MSIPPRSSVASGTCDDVVTLPLNLALLVMSACRMPRPPEIRTVGLLMVRSSSCDPSGLVWPTNRTPPLNPALSAPLSGSYVPEAEWNLNRLPPTVAAPPVRPQLPPAMGPVT